MAKFTLRAGDLRHRVTIQSRAAGKGTRGQHNGVWSDVATVAASIETLSGREAETANKLFSEASLQVVLRYYAGLTTEHRLTFGARTLAIGHVNNVDERNVKHVLLCAEDR